VKARRMRPMRRPAPVVDAVKKKGGRPDRAFPPFDHSPLRLLLRSGVDFGGVLDVAFGHTAFRIARVLALPRIVAKGIAGTVAVIGRLELFLQDLGGILRAFQAGCYSYSGRRARAN